MMTNSTRREFLNTLGASGTALAAGSWLAGFGYAQTNGGPARTVINKARTRANMDPRLLGAFLEHLGRAIYTGVYQPDSPHADDNGFRKDVIEVIKEMNVPIMRYPGGNFVSGYDWLDGVGPKEDRPVRHERAWNSIETNQFGTNEFIEWCKLVNTEPMLGFNLGTGGTVEKAVAYIEYCNMPSGTKWSDLRRKHGYEEPYNVKYWCMGNEMDGPWQMGHMTAREYGRKARDVARQFRIVDPDVQLIACGSSNRNMRTYMVWDRETLEECYDQVDALSLHCYYGNTEQLTGNDSKRYLAQNLDMELQILEMGAVCDYVQGLYKSPKRLWLSFDEWNVWYRARGGDFADGKQTFAPKLLEEVYNLEDALLVGGFVNSLLRHAERVRVGCIAQIINVIAPLVTNDETVLKQSIYYPYEWGLKYAKGDVLDLVVESETYPIKAEGLRADFAIDDDVPFVDVTATLDPETGNVALFMLNRDLDGEREFAVRWLDPKPTKILAGHTLTGSDLKAFNTFEDPNKVSPQDYDAPQPAETMTFKLPAASYTVCQIGTE